MSPNSARTMSIQRTLAIILVLNAAVVGVKLVVAVRTGNLTVLGATLESFLDAMNNVMAIIVVALAARGPDEVLLLLSATALVNVVVVAYERKRAHELSSPLLLADASHTMGDLFVTGLAIASLISARQQLPWADPVLAILVALVIAWSGWSILRVTIPVLVDERGADADRIRVAACAVDGVSAAPHVRSRTNSSGLIFAEVTVTVLGTLTVTEGHAVADAVEASVRSALGGTADIVVHIEPA